jgi:hypothetical protein
VARGAVRRRRCRRVAHPGVPHRHHTLGGAQLQSEGDAPANVCTEFQLGHVQHLDVSACGSSAAAAVLDRIAPERLRLLALCRITDAQTSLAARIARCTALRALSLARTQPVQAHFAATLADALAQLRELRFLSLAAFHIDNESKPVLFSAIRALPSLVTFNVSSDPSWMGTGPADCSAQGAACNNTSLQDLDLSNSVVEVQHLWEPSALQRVTALHLANVRMMPAPLSLTG